MVAGSEPARTGIVVDFVTAGVNVGSGKGADVGTGADAGAGAGAGAGGVAETTAGADGTTSLPAKTVPVSKLTRFSRAIFPAKNSAAVRDGSEDGAGG